MASSESSTASGCFLSRMGTDSQEHCANVTCIRVYLVRMQLLLQERVMPFDCLHFNDFPNLSHNLVSN